MSADLLESAWLARCASLSEKVVLLACADGANAEGRVRVDPAQWSPRVGMSAARIDAALSSLGRAGLVDPRRWDDSGCWSVRVLVGGQR